MFTRFSNQGTSATGRFARRMFIVCGQKLYRKISGHVYVTCGVCSKLQVLLQPLLTGTVIEAKVSWARLTDLNGSLSLFPSAICADLAKLSLLSASRAPEKRPIFGHSLKEFLWAVQVFPNPTSWYPIRKPPTYSFSYCAVDMDK